MVCIQLLQCTFYMVYKNMHSTYTIQTIRGMLVNGFNLYNINYTRYTILVHVHLTEATRVQESVQQF